MLEFEKQENVKRLIYFIIIQILVHLNTFLILLTVIILYFKYDHCSAEHSSYEFQYCAMQFFKIIPV